MQVSRVARAVSGVVVMPPRFLFSTTRNTPDRFPLGHALKQLKVKVLMAELERRATVASNELFGQQIRDVKCVGFGKTDGLQKSATGFLGREGRDSKFVLLQRLVVLVKLEVKYELHLDVQWQCVKRTPPLCFAQNKGRAVQVLCQAFNRPNIHRWLRRRKRCCAFMRLDKRWWRE